MTHRSVRDEGDVLRFSSKEFERRHRKIREVMQLRGVDCLIITGHGGGYGSAIADVRYVSGLTNLTMDGPYIVFPLFGEPVVFTSSQLVADWAAKTSPFPVKPVSFKKGTRIRDYPTDVIARIKELGLEEGTIGIVTMRVMPAYAHAALKEGLPRATLLSAGDLLLACRRIKSPEEMEFIRKSGECADIGLDAIVAAARPGITEAELVAICDAAMVKAGAERGNFILLGSGPWSEMEGTISAGTRRRLEKGDIISNEITSNYQGYQTQLCCPIVLGGKAPDAFRKLLDIHKAMYRLAHEELRPGNTVSAIDAKAAKLAASLGGDFRRAWALQLSELAESFFKLDAELMKGMCYVIHPWTEPRSGKGFNGHTIGNTCIVTDGKPEVVNKSLQEIRVV
jgi:Xaa-Pro aminopeptidase